jgi:hypothetical protein
VHRKIEKLKEVAVWDGGTHDDNVVVGVIDKTVAFVQVEMGAVTGPFEQESGNEVDGRFRDKEGVVKDKSPKLCFKFDDSHAKGIDR